MVRMYMQVAILNLSHPYYTIVLLDSVHVHSALNSNCKKLIIPKQTKRENMNLFVD